MRTLKVSAAVVAGLVVFLALFVTVVGAFGALMDRAWLAALVAWAVAAVCVRAGYAIIWYILAAVSPQPHDAQL
jgi:hypothetical protein